MAELTIAPAGHFLIRETPSDGPERKLPTALAAAYRDSPARGMFVSACEEMDAALPASFEFARSVARQYLTALCRAAVAEPDAPLAAVPPPTDDLERAVRQAPPMTGLEYLTPEVLAGRWHDLDAYARGEIARHPGGAMDYLRARDPRWRFVGRGDVPPRRKQAGRRVPVRVPRHVCQRDDSAGQGAARAARPGAAAVCRGTKPRSDARPFAAGVEGGRGVGVGPPTGR